MNVSQITISGNVGQAPEIQEVNGTKVAKLSVAVNESYKTKSGEKVEKTHWFPVEAWDGIKGSGLVSNVIEKYVSAGYTVYIQGQPIIDSYE